MDAIALIWMGATIIAAQTPAYVTWHNWMTKANQFMRAGHFRDAERSLEAALEEARRLEPNLVPEATTYNNLGTLYHDMRLCDKSAGAYQRSLRIWEKVGPSGDRYILRTADNLVALYLQCGDLKQAERHQHALVEPRLKGLDHQQWEYVKVLSNAGSIELLKRHHSKARAFYEEALALWKQAGSEPALDIAGVLNDLTLSLTYTGEFDQAIEYNHRAISMLESIGGPSHPLLVTLLLNGALLRCRAHRWAESEPILERSLALARNAYGQDHPLTAEVLLQYSAVLKELKRKNEAAAMYRLARDIHASSLRSRQTIDVEELGRLK